ncbi:peptide/nickel transport system permease protein [Sporobacter termitidis DSM 10068]|uniref:Peptide/nickel transport system permease protein n=1 Tax=Sporobacter termitidis DSM 10068 TaxID=1123282 RepID=A0A1M5X5P1_9FIRM|nr:ABC transporter permease [Sporobacter termitidis]SHH94814.1 peptide/nickel transport system permease protein [Sporobacter termitidis DSM 10068]
MKKKRKQSRLYDVWRQLKKNKLAVVALVVLVLLVLIAILGPYIAPHPYEQQNAKQAYADSSAEHLLGTDKLGRDILSRLIVGTRQSLEMGVIAVAIAAVIGMTIGAIAGFYGKWVDNLCMRLLDIYQAIPMFLLCITLAAILGPSLQNAIIALGIGTVPGYARLMRASVLTVREKEYVEAARAINAGDARIILKHIVPNAMAPLIVEITMGVGACILAGSALSFIGLGVQPPTPEWGAMISEARNVMREHPTLALYPGICVMISVLACNLLGDGLRDALDPRLKN